MKTQRRGTSLVEAFVVLTFVGVCHLSSGCAAMLRRAGLMASAPATP